MEYFSDIKLRDLEFVNLKTIDVFVNEHLEGLIKNYGFNKCKQAILSDDVTDEIYLTIQYIIEVGGSILLSKISIVAVSTGSFQ